MFSLSKIKNKKSFFLPIIMVSAFSTYGYGMQEVVNTLGSEGNPIHIINSHGKTPSQEESLYYKIGWTLLPIVAGAAINYMVNKSNEDSELISLNKEEKRIELQIKNHPDYIDVYITQQRTIAQEKCNHNKEKQLELNIKEAQLVQHHQEELAKFLQCDKAMFTQNFCDHMVSIHQQMLRNIIQEKSTQS